MSYDLVGWSGEEFKESLMGARTVEDKSKLTIDLANFCKTAIVKEDGIYIFDSVRSNENDKAFIINGWHKLNTDNRINVKDFGAKGDGTDDTDAFEAAIDYLESIGGGTLYVPSTVSHYKLTRSLKIKSYIKIKGEGYKSFLKFDNSSLIVDANEEGEHITNWALESLQIARTGSIGAALILRGDGTPGANHAPIRFVIRDINISASTGIGVEISNTYTGNFYNLNIRSCKGTALKIKLDEVSKTVSANALNFFGGEFQKNDRAIEIEHVAGINFYGLTMQGNKSASKIKHNARNVNFIGGYQELNGKNSYDRDFIIGGSPISGAVSFSNVVFWNGHESMKNYAIEVFNSQNLIIDNCTFNGYKLAAIVNTGTNTNVKGLYRNCLLNNTSKMCDGKNKYFRPAIEDVEIMWDEEFDFPSVANGKSIYHDFEVAGAKYGSFVNISVNVNLQLLQMTAQVIKANWIRVTLSNTTGKTININKAKFSFIVREAI